MALPTVSRSIKNNRAYTPKQSGLPERAILSAKDTSTGALCALDWTRLQAKRSKREAMVYGSMSRINWGSVVPALP